LRNIDGVLEDIVSAITTTPTPSPSPQGGGEQTEPAAHPYGSPAFARPSAMRAKSRGSL
jgi:hypothetical protein